MKILLVGEYSGVHTELANALRRRGETVFTVSDGDSYKNFPRDLTISRKRFSGKIGIILDYLIEYLGVKGLFCYFANHKKIETLRGYDVVQIINPVALEAFGSIANILLINKLSKNNKSLYLCALGDDGRWVNACLNGGFRYSPLDSLGINTWTKHLYTLRYKYGLFFKLLQRTAEEHSKKIIPGLLDYKIAYKNCSKCTEIVRIPISNVMLEKAKLKLNQLENTTYLNDSPIYIFHGWQVGRELKKGNYIFDGAVRRLLSLTEHEINYDVVTSVPYQDYISKLDNADIFLDQTNSYDRGVNAILGMAHGCVVFSGFEDGLKFGINAMPDIEEMSLTLGSIINNRQLMYDMKISALKFVIENHDPELIANNYIELWS